MTETITTSENVGDAALAFLKAHRLHPTPENYRLAYFYVTQSDATVMGEIDSIADNGMRLTQEEAERLGERVGNVRMGEQMHNAQLHRESETARIVASIVEAAIATSRSTRDFGRDLASEGQALRENPTTDQLARGLRRIIDRTERAERELSTASEDIVKLREELERTRRKADTDELTGLYNRRAMRGILKALDKRKADYCVAMIDIDHFKTVNDVYGHEFGDRVLRHVARCISDALPDCEVARWGGEEFLVVSPGTTVDQFAELMASAKVAVSENKIGMRSDDRPMKPITFSAGISGKSETADSTIRIADLRAYEAKRAGRNRIIVDAA